MMNKPILIILSLLLALGGLMLWQQPVRAQSTGDIVIIANKAFPTNSLSIGQVKRIFQKRMTNLKGKKVVPIHAKKHTKARQIFNQAILGMTVDEEQSYWQAEKVRSGTRAPAEFGNPLRAVFSVSTSVGYCLKKDFNPAVAKQVAAVGRPFRDGKNGVLAWFGTGTERFPF